jgi:hypothetical protein
MKKAAIIIILIISILGAAMLPDEELNETALAYLKKTEKTEESQAYLYFLGIVSHPEADPIESGKVQLAWYRNLFGIDNYLDIDLEFVYRGEKLELPEGEQFCSFKYNDCVKSLFTRDWDIDALERKHGVLLERVGRLHTFEEYNTQTESTFNEPLPPYNYVVKAERIRLLKAISIYKEGRPEEAIRILLKNAKVIREFMALQDHFMGKMVYAVILSDILDVASIILKDGGGSIYVRPISNLSSLDMRYDQITAREFKSSHYVVMNVDKHFKLDRPGLQLPTLIRRIFFKPVMTLNAQTPMITRLERLFRMTPEEFALELEKEQPLDLSSSTLRNYVGSKMLEVSPPAYEKQVVRLKNLEVKIELFNEIHHYRVQEDMVMNPYYLGERSYREGKAVCFRGPLEDEKMVRCLRTGF